MRWRLSHTQSKRGREMADRHYSRQKPGSPRFVKPGRALVLIAEAERALWVTSWPYPEFVKHEWAGAWECSLFRVEGEAVASDLIREAVACTRAVYGEPPPQGFVTFINPTKVRPVIRQRLPTFGYSWLKAGWSFAGVTKKEGWLAFTLAPHRMPDSDPPLGFTPSMF